MSSKATYTDTDLIRLIKEDNEIAFKQLFNRFYKYMVVTSYNILGDNNKARDVAQDVFMELWKKRETIQINSAVKPYLRRAVVNKSLNYIKAQRLDFSKEEQLNHRVSKEADAQAVLEGDDLQALINQTIESLPKKCQLIFVLCRKEHLTHKEIAEQLNISTKTVENHMTKALKILKAAIGPHLLSWIAICIFIQKLGEALFQIV